MRKFFLIMFLLIIFLSTKSSAGGFIGFHFGHQHYPPTRSYYYESYPQDGYWTTVAEYVTEYQNIWHEDCYGIRLFSDGYRRVLIRSGYWERIPIQRQVLRRVWVPY